MVEVEVEVEPLTQAVFTDNGSSSALPTPICRGNLFEGKLSARRIPLLGSLSGDSSLLRRLTGTPARRLQHRARAEHT